MKKRIITEKMITEFKEYLQSEEKSSNTVKKYVRDIGSFCRFSGKTNINKSHLLKYKEHLKQNYELSGANTILTSINSFLKFVGWYDCCVKQFKVQRKLYCSEEKELTKQEYFALVRAAEKKNNMRLSLLIQTICSTGIRVSEVEFITIEALKSGEVMVTCKGKTRRIFLVKALCKKLNRYAKSRRITTGPVFITKNGAPINRSNIWREMKALCTIAGIVPDKVFPHNLRHLFARVFYAVEKDIAKLADILGHENINTTRIYIISSGAEHRKKMENMRLII